MKRIISFSAKYKLINFSLIALAFFILIVNTGSFLKFAGDKTYKKDLPEVSLATDNYSLKEASESSGLISDLHKKNEIKSTPIPQSSEVTTSSDSRYYELDDDLEEYEDEDKSEKRESRRHP